jgi:hypothetical protein
VELSPTGDPPLSLSLVAHLCSDRGARGGEGDSRLVSGAARAGALGSHLPADHRLAERGENARPRQEPRGAFSLLHYGGSRTRPCGHSRSGCLRGALPLPLPPILTPLRSTSPSALSLPPPLASSMGSSRTASPTTSRSPHLHPLQTHTTLTWWGWPPQTADGSKPGSLTKETRAGAVGPLNELHQPAPLLLTSTPPLPPPLPPPLSGRLSRRLSVAVANRAAPLLPRRLCQRLTEVEMEERRWKTMTTMRRSIWFATVAGERCTIPWLAERS